MHTILYTNTCLQKNCTLGTGICLPRNLMFWPLSTHSRSLYKESTSCFCKRPTLVFPGWISLFPSLWQVFKPNVSLVLQLILESSFAICQLLLRKCKHFLISPWVRHNAKVCLLMQNLLDMWDTEVIRADVRLWREKDLGVCVTVQPLVLFAS